MDSIVLTRDLPAAIITVRCPEITRRALDQWDFEMQRTQPGKPTQNRLLKYFNGYFRDECLNEYGFRDISHARKIISKWRQDYN